MRIRESCAALRSSLAKAGIDLQGPEPWDTWKVFKQFLREPVIDGYETASYQFLTSDSQPDLNDEALVLFIRQFSERDETDGTDRLIGRVVLELRYGARNFHDLPPADIWSLDFPTLEEWASVVEGQPSFQEAMARSTFFCEVYYEEGSEELEA